MKMPKVPSKACDNCDQKFNSVLCLRNHQESCQKDPKDDIVLEVIDLAKDEKENVIRLTCHICGKHCRLWIQLRKHLRKVHNVSNLAIAAKDIPVIYIGSDNEEQPQNVIDVIDANDDDIQEVSENDIVEEEVKEHGGEEEAEEEEKENEQICEECGHSFGNKDVLEMHLKLIHPGGGDKEKSPEDPNQRDKKDANPKPTDQRKKLYQSSFEDFITETIDD